MCNASVVRVRDRIKLGVMIGMGLIGLGLAWRRLRGWFQVKILVYAHAHNMCIHLYVRLIDRFSVLLSECAGVP